MTRPRELAPILAVLFTSAACQSPPPSPLVAADSPPAESAPERHGLQPPMTLELTGPEAVEAGATIRLTAEIRRTFLSTLPMRVELALPHGVTLVEGKATETIVDDAQRLLTRSWVLRLGGVPAEDLEVKVAWQADTWGASAVKAYRFGRPEPRTVAPRRDGPEFAPPGHRPSKGIRVTPDDGKP